MTKTLILALFLGVSGTLDAAAGSWNTNSNNVVLDGYDVVAYRTMDKAVKGSASHSAS